MSYAMRLGTFCHGVDGCEGHLGKFDSCRDEALYELTMDGCCETTGHSGFGGHYSLVSILEPETVTIDPDGDAITVTIEPGHYIVVGMSSGAIDVWHYETETEARAEFDAQDERYSQWMEDDDDEI